MISVGGPRTREKLIGVEAFDPRAQCRAVRSPCQAIVARQPLDPLLGDRCAPTMLGDRQRSQPPRDRASRQGDDLFLRSNLAVALAGLALGAIALKARFLVTSPTSEHTAQLEKTTTAKTRKISVIASILPSIAKAFEPVPQPAPM